MAKRNQGSSDEPEKEGYRPLNVGYTAYVPSGQDGDLPKAPLGGTGETAPNTTATRSDKPTGG